MPIRTCEEVNEMAIHVLALQTLIETDPVSGGTPGRQSHCYKHIGCSEWG